jgi:transposase
MLLTFERFPSLRRYRSTSRTESTTTRHEQTQLTDAQWLLIADLFAPARRSAAGGRPPIPPRPCLEGILWVLRSGARWKDLPKEYPSYATCWRRLQDWTEAGLWPRIWGRLVQKTSDLKGLDWRYLIADGTFVPAKRGAPRSDADDRASAPR